MIKLASAASSSGSTGRKTSRRKSTPVSSGAVPITSASNEFGDIKAFLDALRKSVGSSENYIAETKGDYTVNISMDILGQIVTKFFGAMLGAASETNATYDAFVDGFNYWLKHLEKRINGIHGDAWEDLTTGFVKSGLKQQVAYEMDPKRGKKTIEQHGTKYGSTIRINDVEEGQAVRDIGVEDTPDIEDVLARIGTSLGQEFAEYAEAMFESQSTDAETKKEAKARAKEIEKSVGKTRLQNEFLPKLFEMLHPSGTAYAYDSYTKD